MSNEEDIPRVTSVVALSTLMEYVKSRRFTSRDPRYQCGWIASPGEWHLFCRLSGA